MRLLGITLILMTAAILLRNFGWKGAPVFAVIASLFLLSEAARELSLIFGGEFFSEYGEELREPVSAALKILGIGYLFGICADVCRELGEGGIAKAVEVVGRVEILVVIVPFFKEILKVGLELME